MKKFNDQHKRSIVKGIIWRVIATLTTISIVFILTGELVLSIGVGAIEVLLKFVLYYIHERVWNKIRWGKSRE